MVAVSNDFPPTAPFEHWYGLPEGDATCTVTSFSPASLALPEKWAIHPCGDTINRHPVLTTLIRHDPTGKLALFDLSLGKTWKEYIEPGTEDQYDMFDAKVDKDLDQVLKEGGVKAEDVELIVLSHNHFDHTGVPSLFPNASILVGPSELPRIAALKGHSNAKELSWHGSPTRLAAFEHSYDVFGDGSFVLVSAQGHTPGHLAALIRTSSKPSAGEDKCEGEYVLLAADCAHHPTLVSLKPADSHYTLGRWREPGDSLDEVPKHSNYEDWPVAAATLERVKACHRREEVMVVLAHNFEQWEKWGAGKDGWGVELNGWRKKGMKWRQGMA
ncbi:hypothetical protein JCM11641_007293 [Rhodosporidiobolus odoratus]